VTDFYRLTEILAVDDFVVLRTIDNQRIVLQGDTFDLRRRGGITGEGPNAEPINLLTIDGTTIETDFAGWNTLAIIDNSDKSGKYIRAEYGTDMRFVSDNPNISLFTHSNPARQDLDTSNLDAHLIDITLKRENNSLPLTIDPRGMGDVVLAGDTLQISPLDGRILEPALQNIKLLTIENLGIYYEGFNGT
jgi:hypothetical protein